MVSGDYDETRVLARLPNLDIALIHRAGGAGEEFMLAVRAVPSFAARQGSIEADPVLLWMRLSRAFFRTWLECVTAVTTPPWLIRTE